MRSAAFLIMLTISMFFVAACSSSDASARMSSSRSMSVSSAASTAAMKASGSKAVQVVPRTINVTAENWKFSPNVITVKKGENVTLQLQSKSGIHGFSVPGLSLNPTVTAERTTVKLPTEKAGTFEFFCSIPCGPGHKDMKGQIVIQE